MSLPYHCVREAAARISSGRFWKTFWEPGAVSGRESEHRRHCVSSAMALVSVNSEALPGGFAVSDSELLEVLSTALLAARGGWLNGRPAPNSAVAGSSSSSSRSSAALVSWDPEAAAPVAASGSVAVCSVADAVV